MYGEDNTEANKQMKIREAFFKKYHYHCSCHIGYCVCANCNSYYDPFGRVWMIVKSWLRKKKKGMTHGN